MREEGATVRKKKRGRKIQCNRSQKKRSIPKKKDGKYYQLLQKLNTLTLENLAFHFKLGSGLQEVSPILQ